jgi:Ca2+/H+ antiporter, TMEM165/GDT1 family
MEPFFLSVGIVALAEIGDKTQLLSLMLAVRFRKPLPIILGILIATLANHAFAGAVGSWISRTMGAEALSWMLGISFFAMAIWILIPDKLDESKEDPSRLGIFWTTVISFFLAEMGDKTQVATVALAAQYQSFISVVAGTTVGMMLANVPVIFVGEKASKKLPLKLIRIIASGIFLLMSIAILLGNLK